MLEDLLKQVVDLSRTDRVFKAAERIIEAAHEGESDGATIATALIVATVVFCKVGGGVQEEAVHHGVSELYKSVDEGVGKMEKMRGN